MSKLGSKAETTAYRAWGIARALGWNLTVAECAGHIDVSENSLRMIAQKKGWLSRFRAPNRKAKVSDEPIKELRF